MKSPRRHTFSKTLHPVPLNNLAQCRALLRNSQSDPRNGYIKLYIPGTIYFMYYENRHQQPYSHVRRIYSDLRSPFLDPTENCDPTQSPPSSPTTQPQEDANFDSTTVLELPTDTVTQPEKSIVVEKNINVVPRSPSVALVPHNVTKRVIMERSSAECFDELIVRRTMLLGHLPNVYDKAFERAFQTLMVDLSKMDQEVSTPPHLPSLNLLAPWPLL